MANQTSFHYGVCWQRFPLYVYGQPKRILLLLPSHTYIWSSTHYPMLASSCYQRVANGQSTSVVDLKLSFSDPDSDPTFQEISDPDPDSDPDPISDLT